MRRFRSEETFEVSLAPMLDMAFNLLTFFIFTFRPAPIELQFNLNLLPTSPTAEPETPPEEAPSDQPAPIRMLTTSLFADSEGRLSRATLEEFEFDDLKGLGDRLKTILSDPELGFDQATIQVDSKLHYRYLVEVINLFAALKLTKISFSELR